MSKSLSDDLVQSLEDCYLLNPDSIPTELKNKAAYFACVVYPDISLPEDYRLQLTLRGLKWCESPLHDKDLNADGSPKLPHKHLIFAWDNTTTFQAFCKMVVSVLHGTRCMYLSNPGGYYRYLTHADNPEKAQYSKSDIKSFCGFNILEYITLTKFQERELCLSIDKFIIDCDIREYDDLMVSLIENAQLEMYDYARTHTLYFNSRLTSRRHRLSKKIVEIREVQDEN